MDAVRHRITARWNCSDAITAVDGFSDFPAAIQDETRKQGSDGSGIKAVYHWGTIYFVRENLRSETEAEAPIFHEVYDHYGQANLFSNLILVEMNRLHTAVGGDKGTRVGARKRGIYLTCIRLCRKIN